MNEDKQKICDLLLPVLQATRELYDLVSLEYVEQDEYTELVKGKFANGAEKVANVSLNSDVAMIRHIVEQIV